MNIQEASHTFIGLITAIALMQIGYWGAKDKDPFDFAFFMLTIITSLASIMCLILILCLAISE